MSKTIETHLQSNEVRIPKKSSLAASATTAEFDVSSTAAPCQYFKSSFARSLSFSQGGQGHYGGGGDNHFTRSLDFEVNYGLSTIPDGGGGGGAGGSSQTTPSASPVFDPEREMLVGDKTKLANGISTANGGVVKTLWNYAKGSPAKTASPGGTPSKLASGAAVAASTAASSAAMSGSGSSSSTRKSVEANEIEVLRLRKECQNLIEENRRLVNLAANSGYAINGLMNGNGGGHGGHHGGGHGGSSGSGSSSLTTSLGLGLAGGGGGAGGATVAGMYSTVESVILQTQVETLQWQLKQVDSSRQMYRAVMEEVVRYLDRCYRSLDVIGSTGTNIGRSKSVLQVSRVPSTSSSSIHHNHDSDSSNASSPRARSSTNLIDVQKMSSSSSYTKKQHQLQQQQQQQQQQSQPGTTSNGTAVTNGNHNSLLLDEDSVVVSPSPAGSYSTFRDFTWRRSPKRQPNQLPATLPISGAEVDPEKLAQEAFRLLRTVQNLLNTQEPTLSSQSASSSASSELDSLLLLAGGSGGGGSATGSTTTLTGTGVTAPVVNTRSNVGFSRKLNMRGSRLSLRSSTDDSVHSTSSSNNEDNTDRPSPPLGHHLNHHLNHHHHPASSSSSSTSSSSGHLVNHRHSANIDRIKEMMIASSAEDESGFSSMNSFQEIGLPLVNSTMLSASTNGSNSSAASSTGSVSFVSDESSDLRDATVIPTHPSNVTTIAINPPKLGIPAATTQAAAASKAPEIPARVTQSAAYEHHNHFVNHRRWDSAPVVLPQKLKIHQNGGAAGGDSDGGVSSRVLWV